MMDSDGMVNLETYPLYERLGSLRCFREDTEAGSHRLNRSQHKQQRSPLKPILNTGMRISRGRAGHRSSRGVISRSPSGRRKRILKSRRAGPSRFLSISPICKRYATTSTLGSPVEWSWAHHVTSCLLHHTSGAGLGKEQAMLANVGKNRCFNHAPTRPALIFVERRGQSFWLVRSRRSRASTLHWANSGQTRHLTDSHGNL